MLSFAPDAVTAAKNATDGNCEPRSVFIISGQEVKQSAFVVASTQKIASKVFEILLNRLFLLKMSVVHTTVTTPRAT